MNDLNDINEDDKFSDIKETIKYDDYPAITKLITHLLEEIDNELDKPAEVGDYKHDCLLGSLAENTHNLFSTVRSFVHDPNPYSYGNLKDHLRFIHGFVVGLSAGSATIPSVACDARKAVEIVSECRFHPAAHKVYMRWLADALHDYVNDDDIRTKISIIYGRLIF